jgi:hypothetical protein
LQSRLANEAPQFVEVKDLATTLQPQVQPTEIADDLHKRRDKLAEMLQVI